MPTPNPLTASALFDLTGKSAVVIGGTGVLCGVLAQGLAEAGAKVILVGRSADKAAIRLEQIEAAGAHGRFVAADVANRSSLITLLNNVLSQEGTVDILINGAGINSPTPLLDIPDEEFNRIIDINLGAVLRSCQIFGTQMLSQTSGGSIINIGSISGLSPLSRVFTYSASKAALHNLSRNMAREWANKGVRVNTLVPGFFPAEQNRKVLDESRIAAIMNHTPMKRFGEPSELIGAALLLACPKAGGFITGTEIIVDGGYNCMSI